APSSVWISTARSLAVFDISEAIENGVCAPYPVHGAPLDGRTPTPTRPKPFQCSIKPRSAKADVLIQQDVDY
ncbi:hypothetical protein EDB19DRAFT_1637295, partial [Suillus lakei]